MVDPNDGKNISGPRSIKNQYISPQSIDVEKVFTKSRSYDVIIYEDTKGEVHASGPNGDIATGDASSVVATAVENNPTSSFWVSGDISVKSTISVDLGGASGLVFHMGGRFQPSSGLTHVMELTNGGLVEVKYQVGSGAGANYTYAQDFSSNVEGLDTALYIRGINNIDIHFRGKGWTGRGVEIEDELAGEPSTSEITIGSFKANGIGQSMYCDISSGFGTIDNVFVSERDGSYLSGSDLNIAYYENYYTSGSNPVKIEDATPLHVEHLATGPDVTPLIVIRDCNEVTIDHVYAYGNGNAVNGVLLEDCDQLTGTIQTHLCKGYGVILDGVDKGSKVTHLSTRDRRSIHLKTAAGQTRELDLYEYSLRSDERAMDISTLENGPISRTNIHGIFKESNWTDTTGESTIHVDSAKHEITFHEALFEGKYVEYHFNIPERAQIRLLGCNTRGEPKASKFRNFPLAVQNDGSFITEESGTVSNAVPIGSDSSTGNVNVAVEPNLNRKLRPEHINSVNLSNPTASDYAAFVKDIKTSEDNRKFIVTIWIDTLCSTIDETADLSWKVDASQR